MAAGDTFRAAARDQLEVWAERTGSEIVIDNDKKAQPPAGMIYGLTRIMKVLCCPVRSFTLMFRLI